MDSIPAACNGNCGRVVHFPSRQKLFTHLREKHGVTGFQRRGRESRKARQVTRSILVGTHFVGSLVMHLHHDAHMLQDSTCIACMCC